MEHLDQKIAAYYILHHMRETINNPFNMFLHLSIIDYIGDVVKYPEFNYERYFKRCELLAVNPAPHHNESAPVWTPESETTAKVIMLRAKQAERVMEARKKK